MLSLKMALRSIGANKLRAVLTMLGIIIGVMALVVLVSLVRSATDTVTSEVSSLGSSLLTVSVTDDKGKPVRLEDFQEWIDSEPSIAAVSPYATDNVTGKYALKSAFFTVYGTTPDYLTINGEQLVQGRFLKNTDLENASRVCVINETTANDMIGYTDCVGKEISLNGVKYTVVGVLKDDNSSSLATLLSFGTKTAYIPYTSLVRLSAKIGPVIDTFYIGPQAGFSVDDAEKAMTSILTERFEEDDDAFRISSQNVIEEAMSSITNVLTIL
ncbi:MAG: ABC transporter permease, partial [Oscillospiraceae bacterium]|nr:ABC transporter permease [Oscillospiraceae bacterium]